MSVAMPCFARLRRALRRGRVVVEIHESVFAEPCPFPVVPPGWYWDGTNPGIERRLGGKTEYRWCGDGTPDGERWVRYTDWCNRHYYGVDYSRLDECHRLTEAGVPDADARSGYVCRDPRPAVAALQQALSLEGAWFLPPNGPWMRVESNPKQCYVYRVARPLHDALRACRQARILVRVRIGP